MCCISWFIRVWASIRPASMKSSSHGPTRNSKPSATNMKNVSIYRCMVLSPCKAHMPLSYDDVIKWKHFLVTGEFPSQRPVTRSFDVLFDLRLNKRMSKQSTRWWFETPSCPLWRHCNVKSIETKKCLFDEIFIAGCNWFLKLPLAGNNHIAPGYVVRFRRQVRSMATDQLVLETIAVAFQNWSERLCHRELYFIKVQSKTGLLVHDDVIKWKNFPRYRPFVWGIHRSAANSPHNGQRRRALMFPLICAWTNGWVNNRDTCDLRCHRAHYDVIVMQHLELVNVTDTEKPCASWSSGIGRIRLPASTATVQQAVPTNSRNRPTWHPSLHTDFIRLGSVTKNRKNKLTREQLAVGTDSRSVSTGPSRLFSVLMAGCHVGYSRVRRYCLLYLQTVKYDQCQRLRIETARWERPPVLREMGHCEICHQCAEE